MSLGLPERLYWNAKYSNGGKSGKGSVGEYRKWKWRKINSVIGNFHEVIDIGCGDLSFWNCKDGKRRMNQPEFKYSGLDISDYIIKKNSERFKKFSFFRRPSHEYLEFLSAPVVFALDLIFHIMDRQRMIETIQNLCEYSRRWIVIYNWVRNPFLSQGKDTDGVSQHFWNLDDYEVWQIFNKWDFRIRSQTKSPYDPYGALTIFRNESY